MPLLEVRNLKKIYTTRFGGNQIQALSNVSFAVESGEYVAIMGESGSGKTTLLNILAALDRPTSGEVFLNGKALFPSANAKSPLSAAKTWVLYFRILIFWILFPCRTISSCRWYWQEKILQK